MEGESVTVQVQLEHSVHTQSGGVPASQPASQQCRLQTADCRCSRCRPELEPGSITGGRFAAASTAAR